MELATAVPDGLVMIVPRRSVPTDALDTDLASTTPVFALESGLPTIAQPLDVRTTVPETDTVATELASVVVDSLVLIALLLPAPTSALDMVFAMMVDVSVFLDTPTSIAPSRSAETDASSQTESATTEPVSAVLNGTVLIAKSPFASTTAPTMVSVSTELAGANLASEVLTAVSRLAPTTAVMPDGATTELVFATPSMLAQIARFTKRTFMSQ